MKIVSLFVPPFARSTRSVESPTGLPHVLLPSRRLLQHGIALAAVLCLAACALGPDYRQPEVQVPESFKEGTDWQRAQANPQASLASDWWRMYNDDKLTSLIEQSQKANQSIAAAEAAYRVALAIVQVNRAQLFPVIGADLSATRSGTPSGGTSRSATGSITPGVSNDFIASASATWELDLWGAIRRQVESARGTAQATDAQLAGQRLSIAASVAIDYFELRQADIDIQLLEQQKDINSRILYMTQEAYRQGMASNDQVLAAQDNLEVTIADLQTTHIVREQDEHAIAVLVGEPPANFSIAPDPSYAFVLPEIPLGLPSQLLQRRYDVVAAERTAASANALIGVAEAAFFPTVTLSATGGFQHNTFANLFSLPNRFWTLGPDLAQTIFDGGARTAAVREARATYDQDVANYRNTVLTAFQSVEDSLSSVNHLRQQTQSFTDILQRNQQLFASSNAQFDAGAASQQDVLTQQLTLLLAEQNLSDTQALLTQSSVALIRNLGGGWDFKDMQSTGANSTTSPAPAKPASDQQQTSTAETPPPR
ncbi:efflux transporter outer membrane subunit [Paraburkholderia rhizosphaerae]|uniref:NodT family efflux transporter outer membrane factor (OMF) lipoprotein n=1 Tax=Paraburkholderia rhizosphaerae TaxID=480658 RepID=A0A4R8LLM6_9BURK|nr:efflux transporter outer membrane subunit [Paraburkholderia rhizosphaerae]TDY45448.1 NodT family efflux transporter outer membrane factor (OMF) lipoprotein [Paraburkholderia rhizosphaerae]